MCSSDLVETDRPHVLGDGRHQAPHYTRARPIESCTTMDFAALRASTIPALLVGRARTRPGRVAFRAKELGVYRETTWGELALRVAAVAHGFAAEFGVKRGATVAIIGNPCPEWTIADLAAQALGAVTYGIYPTSAPADRKSVV